MAMTVKALIEELQAFDPDTLVVVHATEGLDSPTQVDRILVREQVGALNQGGDYAQARKFEFGKTVDAVVIL